MSKASNSNEFKKFFKIFFNDSAAKSADGLSLTFIGLDNEKLVLPDFPEFLISFNDLVKKKKSQLISNIKEIITYGKADKSKYSQFLILLYSFNTPDNKTLKAGLLIGNQKEIGFTLVGLWPFNSPQNNDSVSIENFHNLLKMIIEQKSNLQDVVLIT